MVIVMFWLLRHLFRVQPAGDVWYFALKSKKSCVQKIFNARVGNLNDAGGGRQRLDAGAQAFHIGDALRAVGQIGLGQHDAIGDRNLLDRFFLRIERGLSVDRIHKGDDALKPETQHQIGMMHDRVQHRGRIGQARRLDQHARELRHAAVVAFAQRILQRGDQVAANGAAQAARRHQHHVAVHFLHEQMIEAYFAKLVDEDQRVGKRRISQQPVEERGFSSAQKPRQYGEGNRRRRTAVFRVRHGFNVPPLWVGRGLQVLRQALERVLLRALARV